MKKAPRKSSALPADLRRLLATLPAAVLPRSPAPMLASLVAEPFDHPDWMFEPKYDGLRVLGIFDGGELTLLSRNQQSQNFPFPDVAEALRASLQLPTVVDGEVVCFDHLGRSSFRMLQQRFHLKDPGQVRERMERFPAYLYLFDVLHLNGRDVTGLALTVRKQLLHAAVRWSDRVRETPSEPAEGKSLLRAACQNGEEGIIAKFGNSQYTAGRGGAWLKIKCIGRQEFVVGGFTEPQRSRVGLGALLVGYYDAAGKALHYAGKVGTGYTKAVLLDLRDRLGRIEQKRSPFVGNDAVAGAGVHWVKPALVAEIAFAEWTQNGLLRQPRFEGLRPDKAPTECKRETPRDAAAEPAANGRRPKKGKVT